MKITDKTEARFPKFLALDVDGIEVRIDYDDVPVGQARHIAAAIQAALRDVPSWTPEHAGHGGADSDSDEPPATGCTCTGTADQPACAAEGCGFCCSAPKVQLYYVQDTRSFTGNNVTWWCPKGAGYTSHIAHAGKFTLGEGWSRETDVLWPCEVVDQLWLHHIDMQHLHRDQNDKHKLTKLKRENLRKRSKVRTTTTKAAT